MKYFYIILSAILIIFSFIEKNIILGILGLVLILISKTNTLHYVFFKKRNNSMYKLFSKKG